MIILTSNIASISSFIDITLILLKAYNERFIILAHKPNFHTYRKYIHIQYYYI